MLYMKVDLAGEKVLMADLKNMPSAVNHGMRRAMIRLGRGVFRSAFDWLSGSRADTGGFPVPAKTGHLRRSLNWLQPGQSKSSRDGIITAGPDEVVVYDSAAYAESIARGLGSSEKFGPRDYLARALEEFSGRPVEKIIDEELEQVSP